MAHRKVQFPDGVADCIEATRTRGAILVAGDGAGANGMAIGWITIGHIWGRAMCVVMVRPSRHTYKFMESGNSFTVNVLEKELQEAVDLFGEKSGRDMDKFAAAELTTTPGDAVDAPYVSQSDLVIECEIVYKQPLDAAAVEADFMKGFYEGGDYHTLYFGEVKSIHRK